MLQYVLSSSQRVLFRDMVLELGVQGGTFGAALSTYSRLRTAMDLLFGQTAAPS